MADNQDVNKDEGKARWDLMPTIPLERLAEVYTHGVQKYQDRGWEKMGHTMRWGRAYASLCRHLQKFWGGQDYDEESGLLHLAHVMWRAAQLIEYFERGVGEDDRPYHEFFEDGTMQTIDDEIAAQLERGTDVSYDEPPSEIEKYMAKKVVEWLGKDMKARAYFEKYPAATVKFQRFEPVVSSSHPIVCSSATCKKLAIDGQWYCEEHYHA